MERWTKDKLIAAFREGKKFIVIKWPDDSFRDMTGALCARLDGPEFMVEVTPREIIVHKPKMLTRDGA